MSRPTPKYLALLALAIVVFHWKTLLTDQFTMIVGYESVNQTYAWMHLWLRSIWSGHIPWWDNYAFGGRPFTEEMAAFYPIHLLFALVPLNRNELISPRFFHEYIALNRFLGACFMFALLRESRRSHFAAFIAACAFTMGGVLGKLPWPQYMESCIWLPAIFLFMLRALRSSGRTRSLVEAALGGLCLGMSVLAGGVQFAMIQGICIVAALAWYAAVAPSPIATPPIVVPWIHHHVPRRRWLSGIRPHWPRIAAIFGVILAVGLCASAAQLLPSVEFGKLSIRSISGGWFPTTEKIPYDRLVQGMWPQSILSTLFPVAAQIGIGEPWPIYIGVFPMFLAVTAIWKCWKTLWVRFLTIMALVVFAYTLGEFSPLYGVLYAIVPYLWLARGASRFVYLISFALAVLSGFGLDAVLDNAGQSESWAPVRPWLKCIAIVCAAAVIVPGIFPQITLGIWPCLSLLLIIGSCAWFYRLTLRPTPASLRVMLAAFIVFDLAVFYWGAADKNEMVKTGDDYVLMVTLHDAMRFINSQPGLHRATVSVPSLPNIADIYGVQSTWGGGATVLTGFASLRDHSDLLNVRYQVKPVSAPEPGAIYQDSHWKVYEYRNAFPRAWVVHQTVPAASQDAAFVRLNDPKIDLHKVAILEKPLAHQLEPAAGEEAVRFTSYEPDSLAMDVKSSGAGLLMLGEVYYPGWRATVNGKDVEIQKADGGLRAIAVPAGSSHVSVEYVPVIAWAGAGLSLVTMLGVFLAWLLSLHPFRRRPEL